MKTIVFITTNFYPFSSAIGVCIKNLIEELKSNYNIVVLCRGTSAKNIYINNVQICYYKNPFRIFRSWLTERIKIVKGIYKYFLNVIYNILQASGYIMAHLRPVNISLIDILAIEKSLHRIESTIDVIVPTCLPFESLISSVKYKNKKKIVIPFLFDKFAENSTLHRTILNRKVKYLFHYWLENYIFSKCDFIIHVDSWSKSFSHRKKELFLKTYKVEHPLLVRMQSEVHMGFNQKFINIVYTGALYRKIRSPSPVLFVISMLIENNLKIASHWFITGNCSSLVNSYCLRFPKNIFNHGTVTSDNARAAMIEANVLISIGNKDITQLPSKIFEYIATGNKILHFFSNHSDPIINILQEYHLSLCIYVYDIHKPSIIKSIKHFIEKDTVKMQFNLIETYFEHATPFFVASKLSDLIEMDRYL